jgi:hypothetical protein
LNILPMSGRSNPSRNSSTQKRPIRLLRFLQPTPKVGKVTISRLQAPPTLNDKYSDAPFADSAINVENNAEAQTTGVGKVLIKELPSADIPDFVDDFAAPILP